MLMPVAVRIMTLRFPAGSAVISGDPRIGLSTFVSAQDATAGGGKAGMQLDDGKQLSWSTDRE